MSPTLPVTRVRRAIAALAAAVLAVSVVPALPAQAAPRDLTRWEALARDLLRELVQINTTESKGSTLAAAEAMAARARAAGFPDSDVVVVQNAPRKGNLIVRLRGRPGGGKPIVLLSHLDVVEANAEDWTLPPFELIERDGTFYGRGVADDKDDGAIHLALLMRLKAEGFVPDRDIVAALTADEEGGPENGVDWLVQHRPELLQAEYVLNEGGQGRVRDGRRLSHDVQASEKRVQDFRLEVTNPGGHSSRPVRDNAITRLSAALVKLGAFDFPVRLNEITRAYFERSAAITPPPMGPAMAALVANPADAQAAATLSADPTYNSQLRTTCVATMVNAGHARNALPQRATANVNCRVLPDEAPEAVQRTLEQVIGDPQVKVSMVPSGGASPPSPLTPAVIGTIERLTAEMWPGVPVIPTMSTGATDGRFLRSAGIPVYGVAGQFYGETGAHGMNERIPVAAFYESLEYMYRLVRALSRDGVS